MRWIIWGRGFADFLVISKWHPHHRTTVFLEQSSPVKKNLKIMWRMWWLLQWSHGNAYLLVRWRLWKMARFDIWDVKENFTANETLYTLCACNFKVLRSDFMKEHIKKEHDNQVKAKCVHCEHVDKKSAKHNIQALIVAQQTWYLYMCEYCLLCQGQAEQQD